MSDEFDEALEQIAKAAQAGDLVSVAWLSRKDGATYRFGHWGYAQARETLTDTLNNLRAGASPESPSQVN